MEYLKPKQAHKPSPCTFSRTLRQGQALKNLLSAECLAEWPAAKPYKVSLWNYPNLIIPGSPHDHRNNIFLEHIKKLFSNIIITQWIFKAQIKIISLQVVKGIVSFGSWNLYIIFGGELILVKILAVSRIRSTNTPSSLIIYFCFSSSCFYAYFRLD